MKASERCCRLPCTTFFIINFIIIFVTYLNWPQVFNIEMELPKWDQYASVTAVTEVTAKESNAIHSTEQKVQENLESDVSVEQKRQENQESKIEGSSSASWEDEMKAVFQKRLDLLKQGCNVHKTSSKGIHVTYLRRRLKQCMIPKTGTSYMRSIRYLLKTPLPRRRRRDPPTKHFVIVREPYSRMVSGFLGKLVTNPPWMRRYGKLIIKQFRPNATKADLKCAMDVSFPEFVKYFIWSTKTGSKENTHFLPMTRVCDVCGGRYELVLHLETLPQDMKYILHTFNASVDTDFSLNVDDVLRGKVAGIFKIRKKALSCSRFCEVLSNFWWMFQARGLIAKDIPFLVKSKDCESVTQEEMLQQVLDANAQTKGKIDAKAQKREMLREMFLQVPLQDRMEASELLAPDFELFGYESKPPDLFPELYEKQ